MIFTQAKRHHTQKYTYMTTNHDRSIPPRNNKKYVSTVARIMVSYSPPKQQEICLYCGEDHDIIFSPLDDFREYYIRKPTQFPTRGSPVVLDTSQIKPRTHPQHEARHSPCCIRRHALPRSKGRSKPRTALPSSHSAGIVSPDQRVAAVLQHRLLPTMSRGCWWCR